jgi:hypothetical protein
VPAGNFCLSSQATGTTPWHDMVRKRGRSQGYLRTTARSGGPVLLGDCHAQVTQRPVDPKSSVAWELRLAGKAGSTQPLVCSGHLRAPAARARPPQDPMQGHVSPQRQGHLPPVSSCSASWDAIATGQAGAASALSRLSGARIPQRPHSQGFHFCSGHLRTT